ncbi:MAG: MBOAT family O-acyltransferase, partial [Candidatus Paceibacterales bacterium]
MLFNSLEFLLFFPIVTTLYYFLPHKFRWLLLLVASCLFYAAAIPVYLFVLFTLIIIDYFSAILIEQYQGKFKKLFLIISIVSMCSALFVFKYFNFFVTNLDAFARVFHWNLPITTLQLLLPIGLSFHTFQSLSYVIEVYRGNQKAERNFGIYALYVMFYPQLVAGPIERPYNLLHQFHEEHTFDYQRVVDGLKLMAWGMFKKVVIADRLALLVNQVYGNPHDFSGPLLIIATFFFAFQIYCDFSGYTDIAIGAAQVMGFRLMDNFNRPYFSKSIAEFWKRWHISLSSWFRDYVYIPLGGNRVSDQRLYFNLSLTFLISGLWHGANRTCFVWGALNGFYIIISLATYNFRRKFVHLITLDRHPIIHKFFKMVLTFTLVCFGWIFFRAKNI